MSEIPTKLEAIKQIHDWAKWLVTIETAAITIIGAFFASTNSTVPTWNRVTCTIAIVCFMISVAAATMLSITLPEIIQGITEEGNVWLAKDPVVGVATQTFALLVAFFFGLGLVAFTAMAVGSIWT